MPGVEVTTGAVAGPTAPTRAPSSTYFVVGQTERGPAEGYKLVRSLDEFHHHFGGRASYSMMYEDIRVFFAEGGTRAYIGRVVGPTATRGELAAALQDSGTTPADTLIVTASSPGAWSADYGVQVLAGASPDIFRIQVSTGGTVVEDFTNLSSPSQAAAEVNRRSRFIELLDVSSANPAPTNNPAPTGVLSMSAGTDDRASITTEIFLNALERFGADLGDGAVSIPGATTTVHDGLIDHANRYNRVALLTAERGADAATLLGYARGLDAQRAGLFAPWITVPDGGNGTRAIGPEGYVAAVRARAHGDEGPWRVPAGEVAKSRYVISPDQQFSADVADELDAGKVSIIRSVAGSTRLYGYRSLSEDAENWRFLSGAEVINRIVVESQKRLESYVFATIDSGGQLLDTIGKSLIGIVQPMATAGGLYARFDPNTGDMVDPGWTVDTGSTLNTTATAAQNKVMAKVGVRPSPTAALVVLEVSKAGVTAQL